GAPGPALPPTAGGRQSTGCRWHTTTGVPAAGRRAVCRRYWVLLRAGAGVAGAAPPPVAPGVAAGRSLPVAVVLLPRSVSYAKVGRAVRDSLVAPGSIQRSRSASCCSRS